MLIVSAAGSSCTSSIDHFFSFVCLVIIFCLHIVLSSLTKNALSFSLRLMIISASTFWEGASHTHIICRVATSAVFLVEAATWRSNPVFASFYFRDLSFSLDGCSSLGPFVADGSVIWLKNTSKFSSLA